MFIPYRARIKTTRLPIMTLVVAVVCLLVYWAQERNITRIEQFAFRFCADPEIGEPLKRGMRLAAPPYVETGCAPLLLHIYLSLKRDHHLAWYVEVIRKGNSEQAPLSNELTSRQPARARGEQ